MTCEQIQASITDYLAGTLPPTAAADVAAHLRTCPACASEFAGLRDTWEMLGSLPAEPADSSTMRARFTAMLECYEASEAQDRYSFRVRASVVRYATWQTAAAALIAIGIGIGIGRLTAAGPPPVDPQIALLRSELRDMRQMVTLSLLQQQSASERLKGVSWSSQLDQPGNELTTALLDALMHDPNVNVRIAAVDALKRFSDRDVVRRGAIEALSQQTSPLVQIALIDFVVDVDGPTAVDALRRLAADPLVDQAVRARAAQGLAEVGA